MKKVLILGGGLAGVSCSYHLGHKQCQIIEKNAYLGGHAITHKINNSLWDEGPHISFTSNEYVKSLLTSTSSSSIQEFESVVGNYFNGNWIPHPAQSYLCDVPQPLAAECLKDFLNKNSKDNDIIAEPANYSEWLEITFGRTFAKVFPSTYTKKYWTCDPSLLAIDWVGNRVYKPDVQAVLDGYRGKPKSNTHYISSVRYPLYGGFHSFMDGMEKGANVIHDTVESINLPKKAVKLASGSFQYYDILINTLPLDRFIFMLEDTPQYIRDAALALRCSSLLLINVLGTQSHRLPYHWFYVYDETKYSTRISQTHLLSPFNVSNGLVGMQVEVYESPYKPFRESWDRIENKVIQELIEMRVIDDVESSHLNYVKYANIIFDHQRLPSQEKILTFLSTMGLEREYDDLSPTTNWASPHDFTTNSSLFLAGRFGQWKYFWSDDCLLRGRHIAHKINSSLGI